MEKRLKFFGFCLQVSVLHLPLHGEFIESDGVDLQPLLNPYRVLLVALEYNIAGLVRMGLEYPYPQRK